ncbi:MAG: hypothetical protein JW834_01715 [Candidatus Diapherotrites archaeon]|nr:hypothetical protein [Candidatus Diapherotrites archaeon]
MDERDLVDFSYVLIAVGIVLLHYYPSMFSTLLPIVTFIGAFYLVFGVISRFVSGFTPYMHKRKNDWWNGLAILTILILFFGQKDMATYFISLMLSGILWFFVGMASLLHI